MSRLAIPAKTQQKRHIRHILALSCNNIQSTNYLRSVHTNVLPILFEKGHFLNCIHSHDFIPFCCPDVND